MTTTTKTRDETQTYNPQADQPAWWMQHVNSKSRVQLHTRHVGANFTPLSTRSPCKLIRDSCTPWQTPRPGTKDKTGSSDRRREESARDWVARFAGPLFKSGATRAALLIDPTAHAHLSHTMQQTRRRKVDFTPMLCSISAQHTLHVYPYTNFSRNLDRPERRTEETNLPPCLPPNHSTWSA